jgi:hypothetical protein
MDFSRSWILFGALVGLAAVPSGRIIGSQGTLGRRHREALRRVRLLASIGAALIIPPSSPLSAADQAAPSSKVVVEKLLTRAGTDDRSVRATKLAVLSAAGLTHVAEYPAFDVFVGPVLQSEAAVERLRAEGVSARVAPELEGVEIGDRFYSPSGALLRAGTTTATLPSIFTEKSFTSESGSGLYVLTFSSYPLAEWLQEISGLGLYVLEPLPPASYIVYGDRTTIEALPTTLSYVEGVFGLTADIKTIPVNPSPPDSVYQGVIVDAVEAEPDQSILSYLESVADEGNVYLAEQNGITVRYTCRLTDFDIAILAGFDTVYTISSAAAGEPSSEREGGLTILSESTWALPATAQSYWGWLGTKNLTSFPNTVVGLVDTGFDTTGLPNHPDFTSTGTPTGTHSSQRRSPCPGGSSVSSTRQRRIPTSTT